MPLNYACFISYRHLPGSQNKKTIDELYDALVNEIANWVSKPIYRDNNRLNGGDFFEPALARALCESVCMIVVYIPTYFDEDYTYCAREYKAMEFVEQRRLNLLKNQSARDHGLIIPIICRDWDNIPRTIKDRRHCYNFEPYLLQRKKLTDHPQVRDWLAGIGRYVRDRYKTFNNIIPDPCADCGQFDFPNETDIKDWLSHVKGARNGFPGR